LQTVHKLLQFVCKTPNLPVTFPDEFAAILFVVGSNFGITMRSESTAAPQEKQNIGLGPFPAASAGQVDAPRELLSTPLKEP